MGKLGRDHWRRKLERHLAISLDEPMIGLFSALSSLQAGNPAPLHVMPDLPPEAVGAEIGSPYHIAPWTLETLVNELLATPKTDGAGVLRHDRFSVLRMLTRMLIKLENAEDGIFLAKHDIFGEMARIAQRQFPWQRGAANAPNIYRSVLLYGSGSAGEWFEANSGIAVSDFIKVGVYLSRALGRAELIDRRRDLSDIEITPEQREAALAKFALGHAAARERTAAMRKTKRHTAYRPSTLRDFPILAFGPGGARLRAPIPELITYRYTSGLYLDVVPGGAAVWTDIGRRFEGYCRDYLAAMMESYSVEGERAYGPKKARYRTPDILISSGRTVVAAIECKAKRMSFAARYADDPVTEAALGFDELAKGIFQLWRFLAHARRDLLGEMLVAVDCQAILITADSWLSMARNQVTEVMKAAHALADQDGDIALEDRRDIAFCQIEDVEFALQHGSAESFLTACRDIASGDKVGWMLSVAHAASQDGSRPYPFRDQVADFLPWMRREEGRKE